MKENGSTQPWKSVQLGQILQRHNEIIHPGDHEAGQATFVGLEHIEANTGRRLGSSNIDLAKLSGRKPTFRRGQIVYGYLRPYLNKVWIADIDGCSSVDQFAFDVDKGLASTSFVAAFMRSDTFLQRAQGVTTTGQLPRISIDEIMAVEINLPGLVEQERIAGRLTEQLAAVERARAAVQCRLDAAQALSAAYLREAFGASPSLSASLIQPSEPTRTGWRWHRLTDLARLATGHTPSRRVPGWWGGDIHWLQLPDIRAVDGRRVRSTLEQTNEIGLANSAAVLLPEGTVCMSRTASVGFVSILGRAMATSQDFVNWVCGRELDPDFLMYLILRCRSEIRALGSGATHHSIYFETVENFSVCIPPIAEQRRIAADLASRFAEAEQLAKLIRDEVAALEALPAALMREAFQQAI